MNEGLRKSAILLMSLGEDGAGSVLRQLPQSVVATMSEAMAGLSKVRRDEGREVMEESRRETEQYSALHLGSGSYLRAALNKALGDDRAADLLENILQTNDSAGGIEQIGRASCRGRGESSGGA